MTPETDGVLRLLLDGGRSLGQQSSDPHLLKVSWHDIRLAPLKPVLALVQEQPKQASSAQGPGESSGLPR